MARAGLEYDVAITSLARIGSHGGLFTSQCPRRKQREALGKGASSGYARSTVSRSVPAAGALGTALRGVPIATEPGRCHRHGRGYARNISFPFCASDGGPAIERKAVSAALRFHHRKTAFVANMVDRFNRAHGSEDATPLAVMSATTVGRDLRQPKRGIGCG